MSSYPLSPLQQGMLFHHLSDPDSGIDIEQIVCELHEELQIEAFEQAWQKVVTLHSSLRTSFIWQGLNEPLQEVQESVIVPFVSHSWHGLSKTEHEIKFGEYLKKDRQNGFDLTQAPLMRLALFQISTDYYRLVWTFHHLTADGRSHQIVLNDVFIIYEAICQGKDLQLRQAPPFRDYIVWLLQQDFSKYKNFWQNILQGFTTATSINILQSAREIKDEIGHPEEEIRLSEDVTSSLQKIAEQNQLTLNTLVQGSWALLLSRISGEENVVFGATRACRHSPVVDIEDMVGLFINTLPIRAHVSHDEHLIPWLKELRKQHLAVRKYEHTPLLQIKAWSDVTRRSPLFESIIVFDYDSLNSKMQAQGENWKNREFHLLEQTGFPLSLYGYGEQKLRLKLLYDSTLFDRPTIKRMLGHLKTLLEAMAADPNRRISSLPILTEDERQQILVEWNDTQKDLPHETCIHQLFEIQVEQTPNAPAVVYEDQELTYSELNIRANQLAQHLQGLGVGPEVLVGIYMERSLEMMVGLLGILKAGGAYVPLDPTYPKERLDFMVNDSDPLVILTQEGLAKKLPEYQAKVVCLDTEWQLISSEPQESLNSGVKSENLAYVIYTSGSTGKPKGVMVEHRNVINFFVGMDAIINHDPPGTWLAVTSISFDISVLELFWTLTHGFKVVLFDLVAVFSDHASFNSVGERSSPMVALIRQHGITHLQCTPSMAKMLTFAKDTCQALGMIKELMIGGEEFPRSLAKKLENIVPGRLLNMYGPTETTVWSSTELIRNVKHIISIGRPVANTEFYILNRHMQPLPIGIPGELFIGGESVVRGYLNRPDMTEERFIPNPFNSSARSRLYRTGDLVRYMPNGKVEFLGRLDYQVKIRGFRIELGEVETTLKEHPSIRDAVVIAREDTPDQKRLVAYLTAKSDPPPSIDEIRTFLRDKLPEYMEPSALVFLRELPLTPNNKLDRSALPNPELARLGLEKEYVLPRSNTEKELAILWSQVLGIEKIGLHDNFFNLGGQSHSVTQMIKRIREIFDVELPQERFSNASTLAELGLKVDLANIEKTLVELPFPTRFAVEVCADCNMACTMCHHPQMRRPKGKMPFELWKRCADQIADVSPDTQCWFSFCGEPLLEPDRLLRMISYGKSVGIRSININTNGMSLTPDLADHILDSGIDLIVIGIDGFSKEIFEQIRVNGNRDEIYANVEHLLAVGQTRPNGPDVQVQFIEMKENAHELDQFKKYWLDRGAIVKYRRMLSWGGTFETSVNIPQDERIPCPWAMTMMHVFWDGRVPRCPGDIEGEEAVGNAWDDPLIDLWAKLMEYREKQMKHQYDELPHRCQICTDWMTGSAERIHPD